ncbi:MAG: threonine/serine dehydratase [Kordiimonadaceae bacterium]|jgi:threonine dehydratase|nr:threonine/serine dehydratase [Kordiimonadaceae bacterium]MBT6036588.1 threonine/serine dehydratase [Kordiimonadaceae bacterium]MBT6328394.1 threonine/serine dehydratase [Kordiimonadaceae bacterium]MBT7582445.1 threonine/serine dehydratase [Kordiimonadaceae bacterium]
MTKEKGTDQFIEIAKATARIKNVVKPTPLRLSKSLSDEKTSVYYKMENLNPTGSFKLRGAANKILSMSEAEREKGVVTASTGNHGAGVGYMCHKTGCKGTVFGPKDMSQAKYDGMVSYGVEVKQVDGDPINGEIAARKYATDNNIPFVSPYNDIHIVGGQGTIGFELFAEVQDLDAVFVALGGGGLMSGIAIALANLSPNTKIIACSPSNSKVMMDSIPAGEVLDLPSTPTLSDGTAGGVEKGSITFDYCRDYVDEYIDVSEDEIIEGLRTFIDDTNSIGEGAVGVAVASYLRQKERWVGKKVAIIACGGNISRSVLKEIL